MGEVFAGRYELADPIGRGGVGAVWRAWDHRRRRYVAAKVLQQSDAHTLLRFVREQALRIDHPHVLAPASWAADDDQVLFTMDLVSGGSLAHLIGDYGALPPRFVSLLLDQLLAGLAAVHAEGVIHRDIKPANILLEATGSGLPHLRLSDFGISMRQGEPRLTETNYVVGTPGYFAPEQLLGAEPDFTADLFAVGLVALYLLQGRKPDSQALAEHFAAHGTPSAPESIPEPLWQVVATLLQPDPQARFRSANGARKALASAAELLPEPGPGEEPVEVFDQIGPLPPGFGPAGPEAKAGPEGAADSPGPAPAGPTVAPATATPAEAPGAGDSSGEPSTDGFPLAPPAPPAQDPTFVPSQAPTSSAHQPAATAPTTTPAPAPGHVDTRPYTAPGHAPPQPHFPAQPGYGYPQAQPHGAGYGYPQAAPPGPGPAPGATPSRPGPSPKIAVPIALVALVCLVVGFWALTQT
ncbi:non-specific serine/threonine protein kinase OS=Streptomyces gougerotii OX=53448 GN=GCM10010227_29120 PE=4 SV=1 [Streptomyces diastaticus subsp. diastaticus]